MVADEPTKPKSKTVTTEYGSFIRKKTRYGKKRKQKTTYLKKNPEKVTLGKIGDIEFYSYPFQFPDKIFMGLYPMSVQLEAHQVGQLLRMYNICRSYLREDWIKRIKRRKTSKMHRERIIKAYNAGLDKLKKANKDRDLLN